MAVSRTGPKINLRAPNDQIVLNCPIKRIRKIGGPGATLFIDGEGLYFDAIGREMNFVNLHGYPGVTIKAPGNLPSEIIFIIEEIGDVLNPNYFKEDIRNWNGQGAKASAVEAVPEARSRTKKAEVTE